MDPTGGGIEIVRESISNSVDPGFISVAEPIEFPTDGDRTAHAFFYPPANRDCRAPETELPPLLVLGPVVVYAFSAYDTTPAVIFAIWSLAVSALDSVLKPLLMGRSVSVPMLVIFIGAIGGFMLTGILGFTDEPLVSMDFNHDPHSSIFHMDQTKVLDGTFCRILTWYDNEWGFSNRMADTAVAMGKLI